MNPVRMIRQPYLGIYVNSFVVVAGKYSVLIDTGLRSSAVKVDEAIDGIPVVLGTHGHWDHIGSHHYFKEKGAPIMGHPADIRYVCDRKWHWQTLFGQFAADFDLPPERASTFKKEFGEGIDSIETVTDGQRIDFDTARFEVLHTPGHSNGSLCFFEVDSGFLFTGDSLMEDGFFTGIPQYSDFDAYITSMERLREMEVSMIYSAHGEPAPGSMLKEKANESIACAQRIESEIREYLFDNEKSNKSCFGDVLRHVCGKEGKSVGAGACVTVLTHLNRMKDEYQAVAEMLIGKGL